MEDWEENTSSNSGVRRSTPFDDQYSRSGGDLGEKREGAAASSSRTARPGRLRVDWGFGPLGPPRITSSSPETPRTLAFHMCHVSENSGFGLTVGQGRNASYHGVSVLARNASSLGVSMWLETPRALAFLKGSNHEILSRQVQFVTINVDKVRTVISSVFFGVKF